MDAGCPAVQCPCPICFVLTNACLHKHAMTSLAPASENPDCGQNAPSDWPHQNEELILGVIISTVTLAWRSSQPCHHFISPCIHFLIQINRSRAKQEKALNMRPISHVGCFWQVPGAHRINHKSQAADWAP